jgi:7-cyano-7-deazaguanine synthase
VTKALVLFSGGQDSTTCLAWALRRYTAVETIGFHYGQRHIIELECRQRVLSRLRSEFPQWSGRLGEDHAISLGALSSLNETALTSEQQIEVSAGGLPNTFVPGRNLLFFMLAGALAYRRDTRFLVGGMCETDFSGYPDCRDDTLKALQVALNLGLSAKFVIETPLMWLDKAATWRLAESIGGTRLIELIVEDTHTCYHGNRQLAHPWGYGCDGCPACLLRRNGYESFRAAQAA